MDLNGSHVVVTGAARGIGRALAERFHAAGARGVVIADVLAAQTTEVADALNAIRADSALGVAVDLRTKEGNEALISAARDAFGEIDLFFANAGVGLGGDLLEAEQSDWDTSFAINVEAHIHAANALLPSWLERGHGYFCSTASAAGLLGQIGSAPYSVTKHAAVGFAEYLSIAYGDRGIRVSCLCPMGVNTAMLSAGDGIGGNLSGNVVRSAGNVLEPADVAEIVLASVEAEQFFILPHPEVLTFFQRKAQDHERWLGGMRRLQTRVAAG